MALSLEEFQLVMLLRPVQGPEFDEAAAARIQQEHLDYYAGLRRRGLVVTNGPVLDQPDERLRGLAFFTAGSVAEAREIAEGDPAVRAGRLEAEVMTWWCPAGTMARPGRPFTVGG